MKRSLLLLSIILLTVTNINAISFNTLSKINDEGSLNIEGRLESSDFTNVSNGTPFELSPELVVSYGFVKNSDIRFYDALSAIKLRYDLSFGRNMAILGAKINSSSVDVGYDFVLDIEKFTLEINTYAKFDYFKPAEHMFYHAVVAPSFTIAKPVALYLEAIPSYSIIKGEEFSLDAAAGVNIQVKKTSFLLGYKMGNLVSRVRELYGSNNASHHVNFSVIVPITLK